MNREQKRNAYIAFLTLGALVLIDQVIKIYVKTHFIYGESYDLFGNWFKIYFIENEGMAYGMTLFGGGKVGKLILTFFRIFVSIFGIFYILEIIKRNQPVLLLVSLSMVLAGAIGNIIDSVFYGVVFSDINGYIASWFQGNVVDMFYAPLWEGALPEWLPFWGGQHFVFFAPIWNFADACITVGVALMILFQKSFSLPSPSIVFERNPKNSSESSIQKSEETMESSENSPEGSKNSPKNSENSPENQTNID